MKVVLKQCISGFKFHPYSLKITSSFASIENQGNNIKEIIWKTLLSCDMRTMQGKDLHNWIQHMKVM